MPVPTGSGGNRHGEVSITEPGPLTVTAGLCPNEDMVKESPQVMGL